MWSISSADGFLGFVSHCRFLLSAKRLVLLPRMHLRHLRAALIPLPDQRTEELNQSKVQE